ncbi:MAG: hypothetical protein V7603_5334 [Micromonosporaceae bacterium]
MLLGVILACEIFFWAFLAAGLSLRYVAGRRRAAGLLLALVPLIDVVLFVATVVHLRAGAVADLTDGLAAVYIGFSMAFGPGLLRRMDARFAYRFAGGPKPARPPRHGKGRIRHEWQEFRRALVAWGASCALLLGGFFLVGGSERGLPLLAWIARLTLVLLIWLIWPVSYMLWPGKPEPRRNDDQ